MSDYVISKSGVKVYRVWQDNIAIDPDNPAIVKQSAKAYYRGEAKGLSRLGSENSEDALTWNIFRYLQNVPVSLWFKQIFAPVTVNGTDVVLKFWNAYAPPPTYPNREGKSEVDLAIETPDKLLFIEAKYKSNVSSKTATTQTRDQVIRNIDVGSWNAHESNKDFYFYLLTPKKHHSNLVSHYQNIENLKNGLSHRSDLIDFEALAGRISHIYWDDIVALIRNREFQQQAEQSFDILLAWIDGKF